MTMVKYEKQTAELLTKVNGDDVLRMIELAGRTCYKSENLIDSESARKFVEMIMKNGHLSVIEHVSLTVKFVTCRGMTHELVRHRLASYSQESTRYCNYAKDKFSNEITVIDQRDLIRQSTDGSSDRWKAVRAWETAMETAENLYLAMIDTGVSPQIARGVLPIDLKTEIVVTANLREWRHIFDLRTSPAAHPNIRQIMKGVQALFRDRIPIVFD